MYQVQELARLAGISVRTLHHYDHIGLLAPDQVTEKGYRLYSEKNLERLQQILFLKELDFSLKTIGEILRDPAYRREKALQKQKDLLQQKRDHLDRLIATIGRSIASQKEGTKMKPQEILGPFDRSRIEEHKQRYAREARERYGRTDAFRESQRKTDGYSEEQWKTIQAESTGILKGLAQKMDLSPEDGQVQELIGAWQDHITRYYYDCTKEILLGLGEMYVSDERFLKNMDQYGAGLTRFMAEAIGHYCR